MDQSAQIAALQASVNALNAAVQALSGTVVGAPSATVVPVEKYPHDPNGLLLNAKAIGGSGRIDPVVGPDCPDTWTSPTTNHTLSVARPDLGEMFMAYCGRVSDQATGGQADKYIGTIGGILAGFPWDRFGGYKADGSNWPQAADWYFNVKAYFTPAEQAAYDKGQEQWNQVYERMKNPSASEATAPAGGGGRKAKDRQQARHGKGAAGQGDQTSSPAAPAGPTSDAGGTDVPITQG